MVIISMKTIQRIGILFLLLVFLFGTTGLSVLSHFCSSSNHTTVTVYPELFNRSGSSCCAEESTGYACASGGNTPSGAMPGHIDETPCCKSIASLFKLEILTERIEKLLINNFLVQHPLYSVSLLLLETFEQPLLKPAHFQFYSPPLFGKVLVHYLHQIKIPDHSSIA